MNAPESPRDDNEPEQDRDTVRRIPDIDEQPQPVGDTKPNALTYDQHRWNGGVWA